MTLVKPNLFIPGAAKSGTSSLHNYLNKHPDIFMSESKEPHFFSHTTKYSSRIEHKKYCQNTQTQTEVTYTVYHQSFYCRLVRS